jgi:hypothetical protein
MSNSAQKHRTPADRQEWYAATLVIAAGVLIWGSLGYAVLKIAGG